MNKNHEVNSSSSSTEPTYSEIKGRVYIPIALWIWLYKTKAFMIFTFFGSVELMLEKPKKQRRTEQWLRAGLY